MQLNESYQPKDEIEKRGFTVPLVNDASIKSCHRICCCKELEAFMRQTCNPNVQREVTFLEPLQPTFSGFMQVGWKDSVCPPVTPENIEYFEFEDNANCG